MSSSEGSWAPTTMTITGTGSVIHGVQINGWNFASTSTSSGATQTPGPTVSGTSSSSSSGSGGTDSTTGSNGGLSSGAKAGIGIAVAVGVVGICCMVAAFLLYRKRRNTPSKEHEGFHTPPDYYAHSTARAGEVPKVQKYSDIPHASQQYMAPPVEVSGESKPAPPVEIG
jgi:hypothetical protein